MSNARLENRPNIDVELIKKLYTEGERYRVIAARVGTSETGISSIARRLGWPKRTKNKPCVQIAEPLGGACENCVGCFELHTWVCRRKNKELDMLHEPCGWFKECED